ncbi:MAG: RNA 2',3'-cyclic phosphodiesterase [Candidatus Omnitrophica bacterium]|nr:RNA 2',3'-cyclic phosphodiesterase [Candidatus Omnitrophota bacterium]MDD5430111.1 RNA 2',3'-cyclic phosphodiesterase [Candidatus Omnitrophota bacterium]
MQENKTIRSFIALEVPKDLQIACGQIQSELKPNLPRVKWVKPENIHLTLKFLGQINTEDTSRFIEIIKNAFVNFTAFSLQIRKLGFFSSKGKPRIIFLTVRQEKIIKDMHDKLKKVLTFDCPAKPTPFRPHITLARIKDGVPPDINLSSINKVNIPDKNFLANQICFFESKLTPKGPQYKKLFSLTLN